MELALVGLSPTGLVVAVAACLALVGRVVRRQRQQRAALEAMVRALGFRVDAAGWSRDPIAHGIVHGVLLTVDVQTVRGSPTHTRIRCAGGQTGRLRIRPRVERGSMEQAFGPSDVQIGDPVLDRVAWTSGEPEPELRARMNARTRAAVSRAVGEGARLEDGWWTLTLPGTRSPPDHVAALALAVLDAARALVAVPRDRLEEIAASDPLPDLRARALALLLDRRPGARDWLLPFTRDPDGHVAVLAAGAFGDRGREVLTGLLDHGSPAVRRAACLALARLDPGTERAVLERALLQCLVAGDHDILDALGRIGTVASIPALTPLAEARLGFGAGPHHARNAIRAIQGRLVGAERGVLALVEPVDGALSVAENPSRRQATEE